MYIGLISDTHCWFDDKLRAFLDPVDEIWHAGDFGSIETLDNIKDFKPLRGVYGNCDDYIVRLAVPEFQLFEMEGMRVAITHIGGYPGHYYYNAARFLERHKPSLFVCGHSHILRVMNDFKRNMMVLNPGAAGIQGFHKVRTALRFKIENGGLKEMEVGQWERKL